MEIKTIDDLIEYFDKRYVQAREDDDACTTKNVLLQAIKKTIELKKNMEENNAKI